MKKGLTNKKKDNSLNRNQEELQSEHFKDLYYRYHSRLVLYANKYIHDIEVAKDVVQEAFIALYNQYEKKVTIDYPKAYLFQSVRNKALNHLREVKKEWISEMGHKELIDYIEGKIVSDTNTPFSSLLEIELEQQFSVVKNKLPKGCLEVFEMSRNDGLKHGEIAEKLGVSTKAVEKQISKALMVFRQELLPYLSILLFYSD